MNIDCLKEMSTTSNPTFIFIDGSYFCFYRYHSLLTWWKNAFPEDLDVLQNPHQNDKFVDKFKKTFIDHIQKIPKNLKLDKTINPIIIVGKDCKRENIWRNQLFPNYKANRLQNDGFMGGPFFKMVYEDNLFIEGGAQTILQHPKLEADDCIAIYVKYLLNTYSTCNIYIITSDRDYLQLNADNVNLYNLAYKNIAENKSSTGNSEYDLEIKIIMGDSSDNIPSVFPKCGAKTAQKCIDNPDFFQKKIDDNPKHIKQYELNKLLVDFKNIPYNLQEEFIASIRK
jgi:5'-3' exonuclease